MSVYNTSALASEFLLFPSMVQNVSLSLKDSPENLCDCLVTWAFARCPLKMPTCPLRCHHLESGLSETALQLHFQTMNALTESYIRHKSQPPCIFYLLLDKACVSSVSSLSLPQPVPSSVLPSLHLRMLLLYKGLIACHSLNGRVKKFSISSVEARACFQWQCRQTLFALLVLQENLTRASSDPYAQRGRVQ